MWWMIIWKMSFFLTIIGGLWIAKALGKLFGFRIKWLMNVLWIIYGICVVLTLTWNPAGSLFAGVIVFEVVQLWLTIKALRKKKRGAGIIASGFAVSVVTMIPLITSYLFDWPVQGISLVPHEVMVFIVYLSPALGISLYLAREFALNSNLLREKLVEIEILSKYSIAQEKEKQQLLANKNDELEEQVAERTSDLQASIYNLKKAQTQLIQSEKMASLGELTAGIAHEIQNPLNFVNNFSEVSAEMIDELDVELVKGDIDEARAIAGDVKQNLEKIRHHGKRADGIVKGMLEHSRTSTGQKEPTDLNKLADECLRLAYHGLRAKDKSFNAELIIDFDPKLPPITAIPQDIGRVLLNLLNNAFYAVQQKQLTAGNGYKPAIEIVTAIQDRQVKLILKDNGIGIPDAIKDKIMQPFFTTKPTGQGTGLGLSLSYDIVVKGHGGSITVSSAHGEGSEFIVQLPIT
jgi:signal transduction histidine kinase